MQVNGRANPKGCTQKCTANFQVLVFNDNMNTNKTGITEKILSTV